MKIRSGFVSNSSSSSFVVLYNDKTVRFKSENGGAFKFSTERFRNFLEMMSWKSCHSDSSRLIASGKENVINEWKDHHCYYATYDNSELDEEDKAFIKQIQDSEFEECMYFDIEYRDDFTMALFKALISDGAFKVIYSSEDKEKKEED